MQNLIICKFLLFYHCFIPQKKFAESCKFRIKLSYYINVKENIINSIHFSTVKPLSLPFQRTALKCSPYSLTVLQHTKIRANLSAECVTRSITEGQTYDIFSFPL